MTSQETDPNPAETAPASPARRSRSWIPAAIVVLGIPALVTLIGAITSPPVANVPVGRIIYMDADQPSERTSMLHGMYAAASNGTQTLITREQEPQDVDAGAREWIIEPAASPDGKFVAYVKEQIVLIEEKQSVDNQIWVAPIPDKSAPAGEDAQGAKGTLLLDLTKNHLDQVTHLAWTPDGGVAFMDGGTVFTVSNHGERIGPNVKLPSGIQTTNHGVSNTALISFNGQSAGNGVVYQTRDPYGLVSGQTISGVTTSAVSPDGSYTAYSDGNTIHIVSPGHPDRTIDARYGWSMFGGRWITSLHWSPDGRYIGYTVSKPPVAENEIFYIDLATGKAYKLPFRCGPSAWDWSK